MSISKLTEFDRLLLKKLKSERSRVKGICLLLKLQCAQVVLDY